MCVLGSLLCTIADHARYFPSKCEFLNFLMGCEEMIIPGMCWFACLGFAWFIIVRTFLRREISNLNY